jgi:RNA polymerase sigma-70 factor (ECF subfamily)
MDAQKRGGGEVTLALEELSECIPSHQTISEELQAKELQAIIDRFLEELPKTKRDIFVCRYWYLDSVSGIAKQFGFSESKVKSILFRTRNELRSRLIEEELFDER